MSIFDQFSKVTKDFGNKAQEMTKDIKGKLEEQQAISRLNAQVNEAKNQMKNTYMAIGERYYELHKDDVENDSFRSLLTLWKRLLSVSSRLGISKMRIPVQAAAQPFQRMCCFVLTAEQK